MAVETLQIDERLNESTALQLAADLNLLDPDSDVVLDFSRTSHFEPFGMLLTACAVNRLRKRLLPVGRDVRVIEQGLAVDGIAAHMGFWKSMGVPIGRDVNAEAFADSYLPITQITVAELYQESGGSHLLASGIIEKRAQSLAMVLAKSQSRLLEPLTYAFRELIRNVVEHAMTPTIWLAGMSWPKRNYVQVAVLDEGRGIRKSLADNPRFVFTRDIDALRSAVKPGISRNLGRQLSPDQLARWEEEGHSMSPEVVRNAGYGLYMLSELCREAGQFLITSGSASLAYIGGGELEGASAHHGTALRLVLQPTEVPEAWERLFQGETARGPAGHRPMLSASTLRRLGMDSLLGEKGDQ